MIQDLAICYIVVVIVGIPVNLVAIIILNRGNCGLSKCVTCYLVAMAAADLMVVMIEVLFYQLAQALGFDYGVLDNAPFCLVHYVLCHVAVDCSVWFTVAFTFDRFVAICSASFKTKYCTPKIATLVIGAMSVGLCLKNIPFYFVYLETASVFLRDNWVCFGRTVINFLGQFEGFYWVDRLLNPLLPFFLILTLNALTVRQILAASRVRRGLKGRGNGGKQRDPEMESRRQSIILLFSLSASFLLCWATTTLVFILMRCLYTDLETSIRLFQSQFAGSMIQNFSSCTNTFIYGVTQTRFREQVKALLLSPAMLVLKCFRSLCRSDERVK